MEAVRSRFSFITFKHNIIKVITWSFISVCHPKIWNDMLLVSKRDEEDDEEDGQGQE